MAAIPTDIQDDIRQRLRQLMALRGLSQSRFAERMGISAANMSKHLSGRLPITHGLVNRVCLDYGVARQWLLTGADMPFAKSEGNNIRVTPGTPATDSGGVALYDVDVTAGFGPLERMFTAERVIARVDLPELGNPQNERIVRVSGNSMEPAMPSGSLIAIREVQGDTIFWGQAYVILMEDYRMVKIVRRHTDSSKVILHSLNADYDDIEVARSEILGLYLVDALVGMSLPQT